MRKFPWLVLLASCAPDGTSVIASSIESPPPPCSVPEAVPDDGVDDRLALQDALDRQGCVLLGSGVYDVSVDPRLGGEYIPSLKLRGRQSIRGSGPSTVLRFFGDATMGDWRGVRFVGDENLLADLLLDSSALVNTEEQTHAVESWGGERNTVSRVWIVHPTRRRSDGSVMGGGDCLRIGGEDDNRSSMVVSDSHFVQCDRSGIAIQRGLHGLTVSGNVFYDTGDSDIDAEMTNGVGSRWAITGNVFMVPASRPVTSAISVALSGAAPPSELVFSSNVMLGRGMHIFNGRRVVISGNVIQRTGGTTVPVIEASKTIDDLVLANNVIVRGSASPEGAVVVLSLHSSGVPRLVAVTGNVLRNETVGATVVNSQASETVISGNHIEWRPPPGSSLPGVSTLVAVQAIATRAESFSVTGNVFRGPATHAVQVVGKPYGIGPVTMVGNQFPGTGFRCVSLATDPTGPVVSAANNWLSPTSNSCEVTVGR